MKRVLDRKITLKQQKSKGVMVKEVSESVKTFFDEYEQGSNISDPELVTSQYGGTFMFGGPQGVQAIKKDDFLKSLPKREAFFKTAGLKTSKIRTLEETQLDENYVMVKVNWEMKFEKHPGQPAIVELAATYILFQQDGFMQIVFQLDHQDFMKEVQALRLL